MFSYLMFFLAGIGVGTMLMGLYVALVKIRDLMDDW